MIIIYYFIAYLYVLLYGLLSAASEHRHPNHNR